jgi:hypothetical protein
MGSGYATYICAAGGQAEGPAPSATFSYNSVSTPQDGVVGEQYSDGCNINTFNPPLAIAGIAVNSANQVYEATEATGGDVNLNFAISKLNTLTVLAVSCPEATIPCTPVWPIGCTVQQTATYDEGRRLT